jgi:hypothetical protein
MAHGVQLGCDQCYAVRHSSLLHLIYSVFLLFIESFSHQVNYLFNPILSHTVDSITVS